MSTTDIKLTDLAKSFEFKKKILGLDTEKQVEFLNKMYEGKLSFKYEYGSFATEPGVVCNILDTTVRILEIPEVDEFKYIDVGSILDCKDLITVKFPKTMKKLKVYRYKGYGTNIKNIWIWDNTEIDREGSCYGSTKNVNIFIQSISGNKTEMLRDM